MENNQFIDLSKSKAKILIRDLVFLNLKKGDIVKRRDDGLYYCSKDGVNVVFNTEESKFLDKRWDDDEYFIDDNFLNGGDCE